MNNNKLSTLFCFLFLVLTFSSSCQQPSPYIKLVTPDSLNQILQGKHGILLDVRTPGEFKKGHIPGAVNIDFFNDGFTAALDTLDKNIQYEVYCHSGGRSGEATELMKNKGFTKLIDLDGGYSKWQSKGFPTVK